MMRQMQHPLDAGQSRQPLERMDSTKCAVDQVRINSHSFAAGVPRLTRLRDREQIAIELLDNLLRLRQELVADFVAAVFGHALIRGALCRATVF